MKFLNGTSFKTPTSSYGKLKKIVFGGAALIKISSGKIYDMFVLYIRLRVISQILRYQKAH